MLFHTPVFLGFFAAYLVAHFVAPPQWRIGLIVVGSTVFYGYWNPAYVWVPYVLMAVAFAGAIAVVETNSLRRRRFTLGATVACLLAPLVFFKYTDFLAASFAAALGLGPARVLDLGLPLGISFVTFTSIAYVVDVFRGRFEIVREPGRLAAYILFFPHLIAGPILRPHELIPQIDRLRALLDARFRLGTAIVLVGLTKKLLFADSIAPFVDRAYAGGAALNAVDYATAFYGFSVQIYCDFSGYTDMAVGLAMILKIRLPTNFRRPYSAASVADFWRRWHITLSSWLRDYLYIPLGGSRRSHSRRVFNVLVTMGLGGLWHGASWTFVVWGLVHGAGIAVAQALRGRTTALPRWAAVLLTFHFVTFAWVLFRAPDLATAWRVASGPFSAPVPDLGGALTGNLEPLLLMAAFLATHRYDSHARLALLVRQVPFSVIWPAAAVAVVYLLVASGASEQFIYFEF